MKTRVQTLWRSSAVLLVLYLIALCAPEIGASARPPVANTRPRPSEIATVTRSTSTTSSSSNDRPPSSSRRANSSASTTRRPAARTAPKPRRAELRVASPPPRTVIASSSIATTKPPSSKGLSSIGIGSKLPDPIKLLIGAGGIYGAFFYYGSLQEGVFRYSSADGKQFKQAWFLQVMEALANLLVGFGGMSVTGATKGIPLKMFAISGAAQVSAKACTSLALANGLSFPVAMLAKSGKMAPVMLGSLLIGGATYTLREYLQVAAIIIGTAMVSSTGTTRRRGAVEDSALGVVYILLSLALDGVTAGFQKRLKTDTAKANVTPKPYDFMFWTNLFMCLTASLVALSLGELQSGFSYCMQNPEIMSKITKFAICSAVGQSFIFYTITSFDPLVYSTITTMRKIFSVLLSTLFKDQYLSGTGWSGIALALGGIIAEMNDKFAGSAVAGSRMKKEDKSSQRPSTSRPSSRSSSSAAPRPAPRPRVSSARR